VVDHSKHLKKQMNDMLPTMKDTLILSLLENGVRTMDDRKKIEEYSINLNEGAYCCFCVCIDSPKDMESTYTSKDIVTFEYAVATLAKEVIGQKGHAVIAHNGWCAAVLTDKGTTPDALNQIVIQVTSTIHQFINEYFPITVSIGISKVRTAPSHLNISYLEAQEMINNKLIAGGNQIFAAEDSPEKSALDPFPIREMENDILYGIRSRDRLFAIESVEQLYSLKGNRSISYKWLQSKLVETVQSIYRIMQKQVEPLSDLNEPTIDELLELASLDEWVDWFKSYCIDPLVDPLDKQHQLRITSTITNIQEHIQSHLETDLQLETCCRSLQISASFAKQALKESLDVTFSELVLKLRIEQAKQWLEEGELNINDIATRLQYSNSQNFSRTFKKVEGIPPGQYRSEFLLHLDT
jgi:AraC-like DNA-binding protein